MTDGIYDIIFHVAESLELPVVILALLALAAVLVETGMFIVELVKRRRRTFAALARSGASARQAVDAGRTDEASALLQTVAWSSAVGAAFGVIVKEVGKPGTDTRIAKELADFDFSRQGRLSRTRLLVRVGPALGLMGTLIPLAPALDGLARGDVDALTENLRLAFSITVLGILIGVLALGLSLVRERLYGQDFSDLEYIAAILTDDGTGASAVSPTPTRPTPAAPHDPVPIPPLTPRADFPPLTESSS
jgi:biopolymer transport protein ExbB/TolQ